MVQTVVFGTLVGTVGATIGKRNMLEEKNAMQLQELKEYMQAKKIPLETKTKLRRYMMNLFKSAGNFDEQAVISRLPVRAFRLRTAQSHQKQNKSYIS